MNNDNNKKGWGKLLGGAALAVAGAALASCMGGEADNPEDDSDWGGEEYDSSNEEEYDSYNEEE